jgi:hypothetical protein
MVVAERPYGWTGTGANRASPDLRQDRFTWSRNFLNQCAGRNIGHQSALIRLVAFDASDKFI